MAQQHLDQVLTAVGLAPEQVKAIMDLPAETADFKPDPYVAPVHATIETKVKNDPKFYEGINKESIPKDFLKTIEQEQYGRAATIVRTTMLKAVGLTEDEFKDLGENGRKIEVFTPAFVAKMNKGDVSAKELQQKLMEANQTIEQLNGKEPELEKKYSALADTRVAEFQFNASVLGQLAQVEGLKAPAQYIVDNVAAQLRGQYAYAIVNGKAELRQKDHPELQVMAAGGTKALTIGEAIAGILEKDGLITPKTTTKTGGSTTIDVKTEGGTLVMSKNVNDKVAKRIAEDKRAAGTT